MKFINFWKIQTLELSKTEKIFFRDAISTLQTWEIVKKEYAELELIKKILEAEINITPANPSDQETTMFCEDLRKKDYIEHYKKMP